MEELYVYRHKERKDIYLIRNWSICGGNENSDWYRTTKFLDEALANIRFHLDNIGRFEEHFICFGKETYAKVTDTQDFEFDGYKGTLTKETKLYTSEFEKVPVRVGD